MPQKWTPLPGWTPGAAFARGQSSVQLGPAPMPARLVRVLLRPAAKSRTWGLVVAASFVVAETLALYPLTLIAPVNVLGAVYLLGVVVVAVGWGFWLAAATSVASVLAFDFFHIPPIFALSPTRAGDWVATTVFLLVALAAATLARVARARAAEAGIHRRQAEASRDELRVLADQQAALRRVATLVARGVSPSEVFCAVAAELAGVLGVQNASVWRYEPDGAATLIAAYDEPGAKRMPVGQRFTLEGDNVTGMVLRTGRPARMDSHDDAAGPAAAQIRALDLRGGVGVPIIVDGRLWGTAVVGSSRPEPLPPDTEARVGDFTDLVATAIANAEAHAELTASRARIVAAADDARRRIERDLHDGAQQRLVSLGLEMRNVEASVPPELRSFKEQISHLVTGLAGVSEDLQEISRGIHPAILSRGGLGPALKTLARRSAVPVALDVGVDQRLPGSVEVAAYYVLAEALTNAAKYAQASEVTVGVQAEGSYLHLSIRDDGIGGADAANGSGLTGLVDRVEALGGQMTISSQPGCGTSLAVKIPLEAA
jgi:signal transduction histidine kinase